MANHTAKRDAALGGVCQLLDAQHQTEALARLQLTDLWGVAGRMALRLEQIGIRTPLQLRDADLSLLRDRLGVLMERMALELRGIGCTGLVETAPDNKTIVASRSFGRPVTAHRELEEAVSSHTERAAEKLRRQRLSAAAVTVFVMTNPFNRRDQQYSASKLVRLPVPTADTAVLLQAALHGLRCIWQAGLRYNKAGVELSRIAVAGIGKGDLWARPDSPRRKALMTAVDAINADMGRGTVRFTSSGVKHGWRMRSAQRSPRYTTHWDDLLGVG